MRLKDACVDGGQYGLNISPDQYQTSGVRMLRTSDLGEDGLTSDDDGIYVEGPIPTVQVLRKNDLLLSRAGTIGRSYLVPDSGAGSTFAGFLIRFRPHDDVDPRFLHYSLRSKPSQDRIKVEAVSSTIQNFNAERYANLTVPDATPEQQRRIADFLDDRVARIDQIITARLAQVELLTELFVEQMRSAVAGAFEPQQPSTNGQLPWVTRLSHEAVVLPLSRVLTLHRGVDLTDEQRRPGTVPVITTAGVVGTHDTAIVQGPGVVIGRYGSVGNVHWVDGPYWPHNTTLYVKHTYGNDLRWLYYLLRTFPYAAMQARAAVPGVNRNDMATELVPWIPKPLQVASVRLIDQCVLDHKAQRSALTQGVERLAEYKQSLITAAVTGEIDVATAGHGIPG